MNNLLTLLIVSMTFSSDGIAGGAVDALLEETVEIESMNDEKTVMSVKDWLKLSEKRAVQLRQLHHEEEVLRQQLSIAELRKKCKTYGFDCPLLSAVSAPTVTEVSHESFIPNLVGVSADKVLIQDAGWEAWYHKGEHYRSHKILSVELDYVVFLSPSGDQIKVAIDAQ